MGTEAERAAVAAAWARRERSRFGPRERGGS